VKLPLGKGSITERIAGMAGIDPARAALLGSMGRRAARAVDAVQPHLRTARDLRDRWAHHPLFFLLRRLPLAQVGQLLRLVDEAGEEIVIDLAAPVMTGSALAQALHEELVFAEVEPVVRRQLVHGLTHAQAGEWEDACPPLVVALQHLRRTEAARRPEPEPPKEGPPAVRTQSTLAQRIAASERVRPVAQRSGPAVERAGAWVRGAIAQGRTSLTYRLDGDARRQVVFLTAELVRWLEQAGQHGSARLLVRELAAAIRNERERRLPTSRQIRNAQQAALEAAAPPDGRAHIDAANDPGLPASHE
jgi:hypothetical protein